MAGLNTLADIRSHVETSAHGSAVGVYESHRAAEQAIRALAKSGFDMRKLSIVGKDYPERRSVLQHWRSHQGVGKRGVLGWPLGNSLRLGLFVVTASGTVCRRPVVGWMSRREGATIVVG